MLSMILMIKKVFLVSYLKAPKAFANNSSANIKLSKTQLHKIVQSGGFLGRRLDHY